MVAIHKAGDGFVLYPFGRKIHSACCVTVHGMALNPEEPRLFAPNIDTAREYQANRLSRYPTALPFERAQCCRSLVPGEAIVTKSEANTPSIVRTDTQRGLDDLSGEGHLWTRRTGPGLFELWTVQRTPFDSDQTAQEKAMIQRITPALASLRCESLERLHGVFVSDDVTPQQPDAENIAFYNFGHAPFAGCGSVLAFERSYAAAPSPPHALDGHARYYHTWAVLPEDAPFVHWIAGDVVASWSDVPIDLGADLGLAAWRALREHPDRVAAGPSLSAFDRYGIDVTLSVPPGRSLAIVKTVKGLVDGPIAGFQRADTLPSRLVSKLVTKRWRPPIDEPTLLRLVTSNSPPTLLPRAPFNGNGLDPCDELCVAGIARIVPGSHSLLSGRLFRVRERVDPDT